MDYDKKIVRYFIARSSMVSTDKYRPLITKFRAFFNFLVQKWWIIYGIGQAMFFLWLAVLIFGPPMPKPTDAVVFYPWITLNEQDNLLTFIPLILFILGIALYALKKKSLRASILLATITICINIVFLALLGPHFGTKDTRTSLDPTLMHVDTTRVSGHIYNLTGYKSIYGRQHYYILYQCDDLGIICQTVYRYEPKSLEDDLADVDNQPFISSDNINIAVHIAGRVVYTFPTSTDH